MVRRGSGYEDASWGGNADLARAPEKWLRAAHASSSSSSGYDKGLQVLLDALLLSKCDYVLISASAVSEFALWVRPHLWTHHLDLQSVNRFKGQTMPPWIRHIPGARQVGGASQEGRLRRHSFVAEVFCAALAAACLNETRNMYRGKHCSKCEPPPSPTAPPVTDASTVTAASVALMQRSISFRSSRRGNDRRSRRSGSQGNDG